MKHWEYRLGEIQVIFDSKRTYRELGWGPYQFTQLRRTTKGDVYYSWELGNDKVEDYCELDDYSSALSSDGEHWVVPAPADAIPIYEQARFSDGRYFGGFEPEVQGIDASAWIDKYEDRKIPVNGKSCYGELFGNLYYANGIAEFPMECTTIKVDPVTGKKESVRSKIIWNHAPMLVYSTSKGERLAATYGRNFAIQSRSMIEKNGSLFFCMYLSGVNPVTGELTKYSHTDGAFVFRSDDDGATWVAQSRVEVTDEVVEYVHRTHADHIKDFEGFSEPRMGFLPDGSLAMILRTGSKMPSYIVYSYDEGKTWTEPKVFDRIGVFPSIITLGCGVTVASYGRLGVFLRLTDDPAGKVWDDPIPMELTIDREDKKFRSCSYTSLLPLSDTSFLISYSDFHYPSADGKQTKTLLARKVTLIPKK